MVSFHSVQYGLLFGLQELWASLHTFNIADGFHRATHSVKKEVLMVVIEALVVLDPHMSVVVGGYRPELS